MGFLPEIQPSQRWLAPSPTSSTTTKCRSVCEFVCTHLFVFTRVFCLRICVHTGVCVCGNMYAWV